MSALPPKADIDQHGRDVRFVPKADSCAAAIVTSTIAVNSEFSAAVPHSATAASRHDIRPQRAELNLLR
jgi:hypothetical protein